MSASLDVNGSRRSRLPLDVVLMTLGSLLLSLVGSAALVVATAPTAAAAAAQPARPSSACSSSCWGANVWNGYGMPGSIQGTKNEIQTEPLSGASSAFVQQSAFLEDDVDACQGSNFSWVEAGYRTRTNASGTYYYWSDCRPGSGKLDHFQYTVPSGDYGKYFWYWIAASGSGRWYIYMAADSSGSTPIWSGLSTGNNMGPDAIIGGELATNNTVGVSSTSPTYFREFRFDEANAGWTWQDTDGGPDNTHQPSFGWNQAPSGYPNTGGLGNTCWC